MKTTYQITVAQFPGKGTTRWETTHWFTKIYHQMMTDPLISNVVLRNYNDTPIYMTRNEAVDDALEAQSDYLMMIDSDMCPDLHEVGARPFWKTSWAFLMRRRLRERGESLMPATIGAPYCGVPPIENIYVFRWMNYETDDPERKFALTQYSREEAAMFVGISEVAALPTGLILFDCRQFEQVPVPWFDYEFTCQKKKKKASTEDVFYTRNAGLLGFPQYCNWSSWAGHVKDKRVLKPHPIYVEDVAEQMRAALLADRHRDQKIVFIGDPVEGPRPWTDLAKSKPSEEAGFGALNTQDLPGDLESEVLDAELEVIRMQNAVLQKSAELRHDSPCATHPAHRLQPGEPRPQTGPRLAGARADSEGDVATEFHDGYVPVPESWNDKEGNL